MLTEETLRCDIFWIKNVHERVCIFGETGSENDDFIIFANLLDKFTAAWSDLDVNIADAAFNINR